MPTARRRGNGVPAVDQLIAPLKRPGGGDEAQCPTSDIGAAAPDEISSHKFLVTEEMRIAAQQLAELIRILVPDYMPSPPLDAAASLSQPAPIGQNDEWPLTPADPFDPFAAGSWQDNNAILLDADLPRQTRAIKALALTSVNDGRPNLRYRDLGQPSVPMASHFPRTLGATWAWPLLFGVLAASMPATIRAVKPNRG